MRKTPAAIAASLLVLGATAACGQADSEEIFGAALIGVDERDESAPDCPAAAEWLWQWFTSGSGTLALGGDDFAFTPITFDLTHCTLSLIHI